MTGQIREFKRGPRACVGLVAVISILVGGGGASAQDLTDQQRQVFRAAKTVGIVVEQKYGKAEGVELPFEETLRRLLGYAKVAATSGECGTCALTFRIQASGTALGAKYLGGGFFYTGALVKGKIRLEGPAASWVTEFDGAVSPGGSVSIDLTGGVTPTARPSGAPFRSAFEQGFVPAIVDLLGRLYEESLLAGASRDSSPAIRLAVVESVNALADGAALKAGVLSSASKDADPRVRLAAVKGVIALADNAETKEAVLSAASSDPAPAVRLAAIEYVTAFGGNAAFSPLVAALRDTDLKVASAAAKGLGELGDSRAVEPLVAAWRQGRTQAYAAAAALVRIGDPSVIDPLIDMLHEKGGASFDESAAAWALGELKAERAVERLITALDHAYVTGVVAEALAAIGDRRAVAPMIRALEKPGFFDQGRVIEALKKLTGRKVCAEGWQSWQEPPAFDRSCEDPDNWKKWWDEQSMRGDGETDGTEHREHDR